MFSFALLIVEITQQKASLKPINHVSGTPLDKSATRAIKIEIILYA